jgi:hypothetical protein
MHDIRSLTILLLHLPPPSIHHHTLPLPTRYVAQICHYKAIPDGNTQ